jgi:hypothetical protein
MAVRVWGWEKANAALEWGGDGLQITRRASGQTSLRCLSTRTTEESTQKVLHMTVALSHWCSLPHTGIDCCSVSCSQHVLRMLTGPSHGL